MEQIFRRLDSYSGIKQATCCKELIEKIILAVLAILTIATEDIKQGRASEFHPESCIAFYSFEFRKIFQEVGREG
jgi:hypothetical protein